jgi:hypothetical protein
MARVGFGGSAIAACLLALAAACSSSGGSLVSADQACADTAASICQKLNDCSAFFIQATYGDLTTCETRAKASCANSLAAAETGLTASSEEACAKAIGGGTCADLLSHNAPAACQPAAGKLATGAACGDSSQCQSTYCNLGTDGTCGACAAARAATGGNCQRDDDCPSGALCNGGTCAAPVAAGGSCDGTHPCQKTLFCRGGTCGTPDGAGAPCTQGSCDSLAGLYCPTTGTMVCTKIALANAGESCALVNGGYTACAGGGFCNRPALSTTGTCEAPAADGAACDDTNGPTCLTPAACSASKVCTIPNPASCH